MRCWVGRGFDWTPSLNLAPHYNRLANLRIVNAKTDGKELDELLGAYMSPLHSVRVKNTSLQ
jgi:hypothetical protein